MNTRETTDDEPSPVNRTDARKAFWTSLPGMLTGVASVITAIVSLMAVFHSKASAPDRSAVEARSAASAGAATQEPAAQGCMELAGHWAWQSGGTVAIAEGGAATWTPDAGQAIAPIYGRWTCIDASAKRIMVYWQHGFVDTLTLSSNGQMLNGTNQAGSSFSARKL